MSATVLFNHSSPAERLREFVARVRAIGYNLPIDFGASAHNVAITHSPQSPVSFRVELQDDVERLYAFAGVRTTSFDFDGERTDIHDSLAFSFALLTWYELNLSSSFSFHPGFAGGGEMYCVLVSFTQPSTTGFSLSSEGLSIAYNLFRIACSAWMPLSVCHHPGHISGINDSSNTGYDRKAAEPWAASIAKALRSRNGLATATFSTRLCPAWSYFFDSSKGVGVLRSAAFTSRWKERILARPARTVDGINGCLVLSGNCRNVVAFKDMSRAAAILRGLHEQPLSEPRQLPYIALDNRLLFFGQEHTVALFHQGDRNAFEVERNRVRERFQRESELLFPPTEFVWANDIPDDYFEEMACELLHMEPNVTRVRRAGVTRERDAGRDILADWLVAPAALTIQHFDGSKSTEPRHLVVQCKSSSETVGKGKVRDIRDTVEFHRVDGYFLIVVTEISGPLIAHLEHLRVTRGWHVDWWTRLELEERLRRHPDIAARYSNIVISRGEHV